MINKQGQSALELAIFGSVFLLCLGMLIRFGMSYNMQQYHQMKTFTEAYNRAADPAANSGAQTVQYTKIQDKRDIDVSNQWGIGGFQGFVGSNAVTRSNNLYGDIEYGKDEDLPKATIKINDWERKDDAGKPNPYRLAGWNRRFAPFPYVIRKVSDLLDKFSLDDPDDWSYETQKVGGGDGRYWRYIVININGKSCDDNGQLTEAGSDEPIKFDDDGDNNTDDVAVLGTGTSVVFSDGISYNPADYNGLPEEVIVDFHKGGGVITSVDVMDYSLGEMDTTYEENGDINKRPGIKPGQSTVAQSNNKLTITSNETVYKTDDSIDYRESITRDINLKTGAGPIHVTTDSAIQETNTWTVPK